MPACASVSALLGLLILFIKFCFTVRFLRDPMNKVMILLVAMAAVRRKDRGKNVTLQSPGCQEHHS